MTMPRSRNSGAVNSGSFFSPERMRSQAWPRTMNARKTSGFRAISAGRILAWRRSGAANWSLPMRRNLVLVRFGSRETLRPERGDRTNLALLQNEYFPAPVDLVIGEAGKPDPESNQVAQGNEREITQDRTVMHYADANFERNRRAEKSRGGQR